MFKLKKKKLNSLTKKKADPNTVPYKSNTNDYRRYRDNREISAIFERYFRGNDISAIFAGLLF